MQPSADANQLAISTLVQREWGRLLSSLIGTLRDFQLAEDSLQDAVESALIHWPRAGLPRAPAAWLLQTARRKAIDRIRRDRNFERKSAEYTLLIEMEQASTEADDEGAIADERLRLIFTCCHPALEQKARIALTLRTLGGLTTREIARAFLEKEETTAQRLVRAKHKIAKAAIPYVVPDADALPERLASVLGVLYLIFNEGYAATAGDTQIRCSLCDEAIRLARVLYALKPDEPELGGLLALMLLHDARRDARNDADGALIALEDQDRSLWRADQIAVGIALVEKVLAVGALGPFQLQAAISAVHAEASSSATTRWQEIAGLYDLLLQLSPNPVVQLNRAVANSYAQSPQAVLAELAALKTELDDYQPLHAALADCLRRSGRAAEAAAAYARAIDLSDNPRERAFLQQRMQAL